MHMEPTHSHVISTSAWLFSFELGSSSESLFNAFYLGQKLDSIVLGCYSQYGAAMDHHTREVLYSRLNMSQACLNTINCIPNTHLTNYTAQQVVSKWLSAPCNELSKRSKINGWLHRGNSERELRSRKSANFETRKSVWEIVESPLTRLQLASEEHFWKSHQITVEFKNCNLIEQ
jgi:hypothetical protein